MNVAIDYNANYNNSIYLYIGCSSFCHNNDENIAWYRCAFRLALQYTKMIQKKNTETETENRKNERRRNQILSLWMNVNFFCEHKPIDGLDRGRCDSGVACDCTAISEAPKKRKKKQFFFFLFLSRGQCM